MVTNLKDISELSSAVAVEGTILATPTSRQIQTAKGETVDLTEVMLKDGTAERRIVFWRQQAQEAAKLAAGSVIRITGVLPRRGLTGETELASGPMTYIELKKAAEPKPPNAGSRIVELKEGMHGTIQVLIIEISNKSHASIVCKNCGGQIEFEDEEAICEKCGPVEDAELSATLILKIDDGTGSIDAVFQSPHSNVLLGDDAKWIKGRIVEQHASRLQLSLETLSRLIGTTVNVEGDVRRDSQNDSLVFQSTNAAIVPADAGKITQ
jgi:predicted nucleic-acid-binding Zn-ribbon protein